MIVFVPFRGMSLKTNKIKNKGKKNGKNVFVPFRGMSLKTKYYYFRQKYF